MTGVGLLFYLPLGCWLYVVCEEDSSEQPAEAQLGCSEQTVRVIRKSLFFNFPRRASHRNNDPSKRMW